MDIPGIILHASIGIDNFEKAQKIYDDVLARLGTKRIMEHRGAIAYGKEFPES